MIVIGCFVCAVIGYLIGSINFSIIISKVFYKDDIRTHGSGNAGSTNMLRTHGTLSGLATFVGDGLKTALAVFIGAVIYNLPGAYVAGLFCIIGHIFPLYFGFKGGKGVVTVAVVMALTNIWTFLICLLIFLIVVIGTKYVSLGSVIAVLLYPLVLFKVLDVTVKEGHGYEYVGVLFAFLVAVIVTVKHRTNLKRIYNHTESKISFKRHGTEEASEGGDE
ncbi:MAG: glycerol-3-phosphate 1-O-acyltransferase PlsY [Clostridia bacterium]|nr:glycerol-3-phosphate 1-O-acyltransferase PlsY [Clostridia bacterium]